MWLYRIILTIRHKLYDNGSLKTTRFTNVVTICVGNLTVGGTGKTPFTEMLVEYFKSHYKVAVLSLGYGRRTQGYREVVQGLSYRTVGDEPKQIKMKFPDVTVAVCEDRVVGVNHIMEEHPETQIIFLDDAFQHRKIDPMVNILLVDYTRPTYDDKLFPVGGLRDLPSQLPRAHFVCVTKCPSNITPIDLRVVKNGLHLFPYQGLYFTRIVSGSAFPIYPEDAPAGVRAGSNVLALAAIGNPTPFVEHLATRYTVVDKMLLRDHHPYNTRDILRLLERLEELPKDTVIITTEKDAVKLTNKSKIPVEIRARLYFIPIHLSFIGDSKENFLINLESYVRKNQTDSLLYTK